MTANQIALAKVREDAWYHEADIKARNVANQISAERNMVSLLEAQVAQQNANTKEREVAATEYQNALQAQRNALQAQEMQYNYLLQSSRIQEESRHNKAVEAETNRANTVSEWQRTAQRQDEYSLGVLNIQQKQREVESQEKRTAWQLGGSLFNTLAGAVTKVVALL